MAFYEAPTQNLGIFDPDVFDQNDEPLTIESGSKYFLRFPSAQGTENLQEINVNGVLTANARSNFNKALTMSSINQIDRIIRASYYRVIDTGNVETRWSQISHTFNSMGFSNICNGGDILFKINDAVGNQITTLTSNPINTIIANNLQATSTSEFKRAVSVNDTTDINNRRITSTYYDFYDAGSLALNSVGTIYNQSGAMYIQNTFNGGSISLVVDDAVGTQVSPLQVFPTSVNVNRTLQLATNTNITMPAGTGIIQQSILANDTTTQNNLRRTACSFTSGIATGTGTSAFDAFDNTTGRGLFILPSAENGSLGDTSVRGDCVIGSRVQNGGAITISNWNTNMRNGLRVFTTDVSNCGVRLQCGQNTLGQYTELAMNYNRITNNTITTFNNAINFNPTTPQLTNSSKRLLSGLGTLSFTDISGNDSTNGSITSSIWTDSSLVGGLNGMYYDCGINSGFHQFSVKDSGGNISTPIYYGSNITSIANTLVVRNATTPSNRLDISTDNSQTTTIRARSTTASTSAILNFNLDFVSALGVVTTNNVATLTPFAFEFRRPIQFNYSTTPSNTTQLGFITGPTSIGSGTATSLATERNFSSFTIVNAGTYSIKVLISMAGGANHTLTECRWCLDGTTATFPSMTTPTRYTPSITGLFGSSLSNTYVSYMNINLDITTTTANQIIYINYVLNYTGGSTTTLNATYSYTRIG